MYTLKETKALKFRLQKKPIYSVLPNACILGLASVHKFHMPNKTNIKALFDSPVAGLIT